MQLGRYIYKAITTDAALTALIGNRIYPVFAGQNAASPFLVYSVDNAPLDGGKKVQPADWDRTAVAFRLWADAGFGQQAYDLLEDIEAALRTLFDFSEGTLEGVTVASCYYENSTDGRDEESLMYLKQVSFTFTVRN